jgi:hypothetical protein
MLNNNKNNNPYGINIYSIFSNNNTYDYIYHNKYTNLIYYTRYHNNNYYGFYLKRIKRKFN